MLKFDYTSLLAKLESSYGVDPSPVGSTNAILTRGLQVNKFQGQTQELNYDRSYPGNYKSLYTSPYSTLSFNVDIAGAGTAGVAPPWGALVRACGFEEIVNATAETGTATAGASTTITLEAGASATDDEYNDLLIVITGGAGSGQTRRITDYDGTSKVATVYPAWTTDPDNTSDYSIDAQVVYAPVPKITESLYCLHNMDGVQNALAGARGSLEAQISAEGIPTFAFNFSGMRVAEADVTTPTVDYSSFVEPLMVNKVNTPLLTVHGFASCTQSISINLNQNVIQRDVVNCKEIIEEPRKPSMSLSLEKPTVANKDFDALIAGHTAGEVIVEHGTQSGNKVRIDAPRTQLMGDERSRGAAGLAMAGMTGMLLPSDAGNDDLFITVR